MNLKPYLPALERHFSLIGQITYLWNNAEFSLDQAIISFIVPDDARDSDATFMLASKLGNRDRTAVLRAISERYGVPGTAGRVEHAIKCYSILNENRNALIHSRFIYAGVMSSLTWVRASSGRPGKGAFSVASLRDLRAQVRALEDMITYLDGFAHAVRGRRDNWAPLPPWPRKSALPRKLRQPDPEVLRNTLPRPPKPRG